jgi:hypothetical protein
MECNMCKYIIGQLPEATEENSENEIRPGTLKILSRGNYE